MGFTSEELLPSPKSHINKFPAKNYFKINWCIATCINVKGVREMVEKFDINWSGSIIIISWDSNEQILVSLECR